MARTSKKSKEKVGAVADTKPSKVYSVGIYARLSVDADARKNESIETQIAIAKAFVGRQKDMVILDCYTDIGKTGTNFEREGFERMMQDVRTHKINCIIVKDLSRFGRNYIETGNYIEKIFPFMGVRFIAVTDNFDSINHSEQDTWNVNLKNLVNELYAKDIAERVKSSRQAKWERGSYMGGVAPYGYKVGWIGDRKSLFVEETTSDIVKKIYDLFLSGKNRKEIVVWLYKERIVRPTEYHKTGQIYSQDDQKLKEWSKGTIKMILTNPVYMGCLVQGRACGKDNRVHDRHEMDSEEWAVKEHTHKAIIREEMFFEVARRFEKSSLYGNKNGYSKRIPIERDIFADVLFCGDCGLKMKRITAVKERSSKERIRTYSYHCSKTDHMDEDKCIAKSITFHALRDIVKEAIRQEFALSAIRSKDIVERNTREAERRKAEWKKERLEWERRIENIIRLESEQYLKYRMGEMDVGNFKRSKEENNRKLISYRKEQADRIEKLKEIDDEMAKKNQFIRNLGKGNEKTMLTAEMIQTLINRIEVYSDHRVKILFSFKRREVWSAGKEAG